MRIAVIDGQGGGIGKSIVEKLRKELGDGVDILALGTNALATSFMLKAGADEGATGENAILVNAGKVDVIMGVIGILVANSMLGELSPPMARAIAESPAKKVLIPLNRCNIEIVGVSKNDSLPQLIDEAVRLVRNEG
jgi:NAD(P)-dependent dehydrogenase (short-subunit alcohol dehydrogenase family)